MFGTGPRSPADRFGHHGASGCMAWADPQSGVTLVVLSTEGSLCYSPEYNELSDLVSAAGL
jgi:hypothetical protein